MRWKQADTMAVVIDYQERLVPAMANAQNMVDKTKMLLAGLKALDVPMVFSQQYPKGLGNTIAEIAAFAQGQPVLDKLSFSCMGEGHLAHAIAACGKKNVLVCGMEAHVCVLQTVVDLLAAGYQVAVIADCVSSRNPADVALALERARQEGAIVVSAESMLFELLERAGSDTFKTISKLVK